MKSYTNNYNVRDEKGRFVGTSPKIMDTTTSLNTIKEGYLKTLRENDVFIIYIKNGILAVDLFSLQPKYFPLYVGKGTSKKVNDDTMIIFNVEEERFRTIKISNIRSFKISDKS